MPRGIAPGTIFACATLVPVALLLTGATLAPGLFVPALFYMTLFAFAADEGLATVADARAPDPVAKVLPSLLALAHFAVLLAGVQTGAQAIAARDPMGLVAFAGFGLWLGTVSTANAHELIHRRNGLEFGLGHWVFVSLLFGHHVSAHRLVHHVHVATKDDPNSAPRGRGFYRFFVDAWIGSFRAGLRAENRRRAWKGGHVLSHPYLIYSLGAVTFLAYALVLFGWAGVAANAALAGFAQAQLLLSDYVQHYGLRRRTDPDTGRTEPVGTRHSWNARHWFTALLTLHAARHSDHHAHPDRSFTELDLPDDAPTLPRSIPVMAVIALWPRAWFRLMNPRLDALEHGRTARQPDGAGQAAQAV